MEIGRNDLCPCGSGKKYKRCCLDSIATTREPIILLFGAGASYGSLGMVKRPPLSACLFDELYNEYPMTWRTISGDLVSIFKKDFEEGMGRLYQEGEAKHEYNVAKILKDMAIYFSKFKIDNTDINLYSRLISKYEKYIRQGRIILSTLNYECLIEDALLNLGLDIKDIDYFNSSNGIKLLKLHGSCNFIPRNFLGNDDNMTLYIDSATINTRIEPVRPGNVQGELSTMPIFPAMSLFTREKKNVINPSQIERIVILFQEYVKASKTILSIGVRPNPVDVHIWDHISKSPAELFLIADEDECMNWISKYRNKNGRHIDNEFASSFDRICEIIDSKIKFQ